jgi:hypothetical protein
MVGGFPATSLGTRGFSGRKRRGRWVSRHVVGCWGWFRGRNDAVGGFPATSLGAGVVRGQNDAAGGFPAASLGAGVVSEHPLEHTS